MKVRALIRILVIKTNSFWPFTFLNKIPYHLALKSFVYIFSSFKEVKSIYLRHGMSKKNWVPAISDIDLTVIIYSNMLTEEEYNFLKIFWDKFKRLKRIFPMLGEIDILNENEVESWTKVTIRGYEAGNWKLLYGKEKIKSNYKIDESTLAIDSINYALTNYLEYFIPKFYSSQENDTIVSSELIRLRSKILRYIDPSFEASKIKYKQTGYKKRAELLCDIIKGFEKSINNLKIPEFQENNNFLHLNPFLSEKIKIEEIELNGLSSCLNKIDAFIISYTTKFVILKEGINSEEIVDCIDTIRTAFSKQNIKPVILSFTLFEYYLRIYNPFIYAQLMDGREVLLGEDIFLNVKPPNYYFYRKSLMDEIGNILFFPHSIPIFNRNNIRNYVQNGFNSKANRGLFLKLYLEKSTIEPNFNKCNEECKKFYPQYITQINHLVSNSENISEDQLSFDTYKLLKTLSSEINYFT